MISLLLDHESHGWLDIVIEDGDKTFEISASYLSDGIESLICSLCLFAEGNRESIATVQTEPGEYRLVFRNVGEQSEFEVYEMDDNFYTGGIEEGDCIFLVYTERKQLLRKFLKEIKPLYELGNEEYKRIWGYDFPNKFYERLLLAYNELE